MFLRLVVAVAMLFAGIPAAGTVGVAASPRVGTSVVATTAASTPVSTSSSSAAPDKPTITDRDVVVPRVDPAGDAVATPGGLTAQSTDGRIVTDERGGKGRLESAVVETGAFQTLGLTWPTGTAVTGLGAQVRTRADGVWSGWQPLTSEDSGPDAATAEGAHARLGTDPVWVGNADAVQLSFAASAGGGPAGLKLSLVSSSVGSATVSSAAPGSASIASAVYMPTGTPTSTVPAGTIPSSAALAPHIITRAEWGAAPQACTPDVASRLVGAVVHHTADSNNYATVAQAEQQIRNDQAYHINSLGWCDLGYNFVVDKWGNIYEGRANSMTQPVVGAHAAGFNTGTVGVAMLGNYSTVTPSEATQESVAAVIAWRLAAYGVNPSGSMKYTTAGGSDKYAAGTTVTLSVISGHRDVYLTACPGDSGYAALPTIRGLASLNFGYGQLFVQSQAVVKAMYADILGRDVDLPGLQAWSGMLAGGSGTPALVAALTNSDEYIRLRIRQAYLEVLGREPEPSGMNAWFAAIRGGVATVDDVQRKFFSSDEFWSRAGGTDAGYVTAMYTSVLGRAPAPSDVTGWVSAIGQIGRDKVTDAIWFSHEAAVRRSGAYYRTLLKRAPDVVGNEYWAGILLAQGEGAVRIGIAGSEEYRERAQLRYP